MSLLEELVKDLPEQGGWPELESDVTIPDYFINKSICWFFSMDGKHSYCQSEGVIVTRRQYEKALAARNLEWDGTFPIPPGTEVEVHFDGDDSRVWTTFRVEYMRGDVVVLHDYRTDSVDAYSNKKLNFHPIRSEADKKREVGVLSIAKAGGAVPFSYGEKLSDGELIGSTWYVLYDKIAAGEVDGVRID